MYNQKITRWYTEPIHVDIHTGEVLKKHEYDKDYIHVRTEKEIKINQEKNYGIIKKTIIGEWNGQTKLDI